jgi:hypothetical protein
MRDAPIYKMLNRGNGRLQVHHLFFRERRLNMGTSNLPIRDIYDRLYQDAEQDGSDRSFPTSHIDFQKSHIPRNRI